ncbi:MAG: redoxin domain-containing protein [Planctomycetes bacterium]|nr:redoxin domain-containing protein [Planctomycetota bacterium]
MFGKLFRRLLPLPGANPAVQPGDPAPAWECRDSDGALVRSTDLAGTRYVLWFYPMADTPG